MIKIKNIIFENKSKNVIFVFPGRFQPFHRGHLETYNMYSNIYDTYILTTDKVDDNKSPFTFDEKKKIMIFQGVPSNKIKKVKNQYSSRELSNGTNLLFGKYDVNKYSIVYIVGEKDALRLSKRPKYYKKFNNSMQLLPITKISYYTLGTPSTISATMIRNFFSEKHSFDEKVKFFKNAFGKYNSEIFELINNKLSKNNRMVSELIKGETSNKNLLICGGAYGHMMHPFEDMSLTFGDYKKIIENAFSGYLSKEEKIVEKTDGTNLLISWKNDDLIYARTQSQLRNKGETAFNRDELLLKFKGRDNLVEALNYATESLYDAISNLTDNQRKYIFKDGSAFMSLEIIYDKIQNVIPYYSNMLIFHGIKIYDLDGNIIKEDKEYGRILAGMIQQINKNIQKNFTIKAPAFTTIKNTKNFSENSKYFIDKLNNIENKYSLNDNDTLYDYMRVWWERYIKDIADKHSYEIPDDILNMLVKKWGLNEKTKNIIQIQKEISKNNYEFSKWVVNFNKNEYVSVYKNSILPFELLFLEMGTILIKNINTFLTVSPNQSVKQIKSDLKQTIEKIKLSNNTDLINKMKDNLNKIKQIGGFKSILPSEGIVFRYKGKIYKFTGAFAPVHSILSLLKYAPPKNKVAQLNEGGNLNGVTSLISNENVNEIVKNTLKLINLSDIEFTIVGNIWKKYANDVDIAIKGDDVMKKVNANNISDMWDKLETFLKNNKYVKNYKIAKGLSQVSIVVPAIDDSNKQINAIDNNGNIKNIKAFIQLDLFIGDVNFMKNALSAPKESKYKGNYRNIFLRCILRNIVFPTENKNIFKKYQLNWKNGIEYVEFYVNDNGKIIKNKRSIVSNDMNDIVHYLFGYRYDFSDIDSFEKLYNLFKSNDYKYKTNRKQVITDFKKELINAKFNLPTELSKNI